ncbi:MAG: hypothetical protein GY856_31615, partial [bacterium]|nr:hypothetical protein [bacterium]
ASLSGGSFFGGDIFSGELGLAFKPIPRLHLSVRHQSDGVELPGGSFDSAISTLQVSYFFSPALTTRVAAQYSSLIEDLVVNFRLRWIYAPGSEAWLVYDESHRFGLDDPTLRDRSVILKVVYNFNL